MNKFVIVSTVTDVFLIMCQIFVGATGLWPLLGNNHDLMIMQSWFDENAMKQLTFLTLDYICISRSGTPSRYTEIHFVNNCLSKKRNRPQKRPPNAKSSNANEVPPHSFVTWFLVTRTPLQAQKTSILNYDFRCWSLFFCKNDQKPAQYSFKISNKYI